MIHTPYIASKVHAANILASALAFAIMPFGYGAQLVFSLLGTLLAMWMFALAFSRTTHLSAKVISVISAILFGGGWGSELYYSLIPPDMAGAVINIAVVIGPFFGACSSLVAIVFDFFTTRIRTKGEHELNESDPFTT